MKRIFAVTFLCGTAFVLSAQVPPLLNYQGRLTVAGTNYTGPGWFKFVLVDGGANAARQATATAVVVSGFIVDFNISDGGAGYTTAPIVTINDPTGTGAAATAHVSGGAVTSITVNPGGNGYNYSASPTVTIAPPPSGYTFQTFWSHDHSSAAGGEPATAVPLSVTDGLFAVNLGDTTVSNMTADLDPLIFTNSDVRLRIWVSTGAQTFQQLWPDQRLTAAGYAMMATRVTDGAVSTVTLASQSVTSDKLAVGAVTTVQLAPDAVTGDHIADGTVTTADLAGNIGVWTKSGANIFYSGGNVGIGTDNPQSALQVMGAVSADTYSGRGTMPWQTVTGTSQAASPNRGYLATNAAPVTFTLPGSPALGDVVRVSGVGSGGWKVGQGAGQSIIAPSLGGWGAVWTRCYVDDSWHTWSCVASSADGTKLVAVANPGWIYTSEDSGLNWTPRGTNQSLSWSSVASSADGTKLVAAESGGQIFTSTNSGLDWTLQATGLGWCHLTSSADGTKLVAASQGGKIYTSTDSGLNWTPHGTNQYWTAVASSADGTKLVAVANPGWIYTSGDSGLNWTPHGTNQFWRAVASSADGTRLIAGAGMGQIYTSADSGATWDLHVPSSNEDPQAVASSADGMRLIVLTYNAILVSSDAGAHWTRQTSPGAMTSGVSVAASADGRRLVGAWGDGYLYTSTSISSPGPSGYLTGDVDAAVELQFIGDGRWRVLSHEGTIAVY